MSVDSAVAADAIRLAIAEFPELRDVRPRVRELTWDELTDRLSKHEERRQKDGPGWSPTVYRPGATRAKRGVVSVTALALDFDHTEPPWLKLDRFSYVAHTTYSHADSDPRWRVAIPLTRPVLSDEWPSFWARAQLYFGATADEQCKDCSRFFYLPSCPPGGPRQTRRNDGVLLDPDTLPAISHKPVQHRRASTPARGEITAYARKALEDEVAAVAAAPQGGRNSRLNAAAYSLGQLVSAGALPRDLVEQQLEEAAHHCKLVDDDGLTSVRRTIKSGLDAGELERREIPIREPLKLRPEDLPTHVNGIGSHMSPRNGKPPGEPAAADGHVAQDPPNFHLTDLGNAQRLVAGYGENLRYAHQLNRWYVWDGRRWAEDATNAVERTAKKTVRAMYRRAASDDLADDERKALVKHALRSEAHRAIAAMVALARSEPEVVVTTDQLDRDAWRLTVGNGTLDLRTGELWPHRQSDYITKLVPIDYDAQAECPTWQRFLARIMAGNEALIDFIQRAIGYSLTGSTRERVTFFLYGTGANGKSTLIETVAALLGDYAETTRAETLLVRTYDGGIPNDIAALKGARFVSTSETEEGKRLAEAMVKAMTGGDTLSARFMRGEFFKFKPTFKLWLATNHKPVIRGTDRAIWDRIRLIPFEVRIPDEEQDKDLPQRLQRELPGILAWAVRGCLEWQRGGLGTPQEVVKATASYRDEMDTLADFIQECCVVADGASERAQTLWKRWEAWCQDTGERPGTQKGFGLRLKEKGFQQGRTRDREQARIWMGIGLTGQEQQGSLDADAFAMQTRPDAISGITGLSSSRKDLSRETRLHASAGQNASASESPRCRACGGDLNATEQASGFGLHLDCTEPHNERPLPA